jgi:glutamate-1-semialdehyde aminotransferase
MKPRGFGDTIANFTEKTGIKTVVDKVSNGLNIPCGCAKRKEWFNKKIPYKT